MANWNYTTIGYILRPLGNFVVIWYFFTILVYSTLKNLATLDSIPQPLNLVYEFKRLSFHSIDLGNRRPGIKSLERKRF
jgi:hypothetical protein